jgi:hypothetical protein
MFVNICHITLYKEPQKKKKKKLENWIIFLFKNNLACSTFINNSSIKIFIFKSIKKKKKKVRCRPVH